MTLGRISFAALALAAILPAQESRAESAPATRPDPAAALLQELDARLYWAGLKGLKGGAFSYVPPSEGSVAIADFRVRVTFEASKPDEVAFCKPDGTAFDELPQILRQPGADGIPSIREQFEQGARNLAAFFRGRPYSEQFRDWRKRLEVRIVNGREERKLVCEPVAAGKFKRVEMHFDRRDLPWRITYVLMQPQPGMDRVIEEPTFTEFDGSLLLTGFKRTRGTATEQVVVSYQRKEGFIVPASYETLAKDGPSKKVVFEDVKVY